MFYATLSSLFSILIYTRIFLMDVLNGCFFSSIKEINSLINIYLKVTIEKKWRTQNFNFLSLKVH